MTKMKQNYTANMIMNVSGTVLKGKQHTCIEHFDIIISFQLPGGRGGG